MKHRTLISSTLIKHTILTSFPKKMLRVTSEIATQREHASKNLQIS